MKNLPRKKLDFNYNKGKKRLYLKLQNTNWLLKSLPV